MGTIALLFVGLDFSCGLSAGPRDGFSGAEAEEVGLLPAVGGFIADKAVVGGVGNETGCQVCDYADELANRDGDVDGVIAGVAGVLLFAACDGLLSNVTLRHMSGSVQTCKY